MTTGKGGSSSQISGYKYFMAVHMGIGRGPINSLTEIRIGDLVAWSGDLSTTDFFEINQPNLFGGDQKEGGIVGDAKLFLGAADQTIDTIITDNIEGSDPVPGWRGVSTIFYYGQISSNNPYPKPWKLRVNRTTAGWENDLVWHPELALIPMVSSPLNTVTINTQPASGDSIFIGDIELFFFTEVVGEPAYNVTIGADAEETAGNLAGQLNRFGDQLYHVTASISGLTLTLYFPAATAVTAGNGAFTTISTTSGNIRAMNPAHVIYECATNNVWGRGLPSSFIDEASFLAAATQLAAEGFGICLRWNRQEDIDKFVDTIVNHIAAAVFVNRITGLLTLNLIRDNYDPEALPEFTFENGILDLQEDESSSSDTTYNEIIVTYTDPISGNKAQVRAQNLASFQSLGSLISTTAEYLALPTANLAQRVAQRDLQANSSDVRRLRLKMDRVGWNISPGDVFKLSLPSRGIGSMVVRVGQIDDGPLESGEISMSVVQDVFALPWTAFVAPQPSFWTPTDRTARVIDERFVEELTYYDLSFNVPPAELAIIPADTGMIKVYAEAPTGLSVDYVVTTKTSLETEFQDRTIAGYDAGAILAAPIALHDTLITYEEPNGFSQVEAAGTGIPILLVDADDPTIHEYVKLVSIDLVDSEIVVERGCIDTVPHVFAAGAHLWFQTNMPTTDFRDYATSEIVNVKLLSRTSSERLDPDVADIDDVTIGGRQGRPYPPGNLEIDSIAFELSQIVEGDIVLDWTHRDRIIQGNSLLGHTAGSTGPEAGTTYNVLVYDGSDPTPTTLLRTEVVAGTTFTYESAMDVADGSLHSYWFRVESERDSLVSWQAYEFKVHREADFDFGFDFNFDGTP